MKPTHVKIDNATTYKLGRVLQSGSRGTERECIADGLVYRVCHWAPFIQSGMTVRTGGQTLKFI